MSTEEEKYFVVIVVAIALFIILWFASRIIFKILLQLVILISIIYLMLVLESQYHISMFGAFLIPNPKAILAFVLGWIHDLGQGLYIQLENN